MSIGAPFARHFGLERLGIHHERLPPGRRTSYPHAESAEEEFVYVIEGTPDVWLDGRLHRLKPGDAVGFPAGTGLATASSTTPRRRCGCWSSARRRRPRTASTIRATRSGSRCATTGGTTCRERPMGDHDGLPDQVRARRVGQGE